MATRTKLTYDVQTGLVRIRILKRHGRERRYRPIAVMPVDRADLRDLCDRLHDFADELDRRDREA